MEPEQEPVNESSVILELESADDSSDQQRPSVEMPGTAVNFKASPNIFYMEEIDSEQIKSSSNSQRSSDASYLMVLVEDVGTT